MVVYSDKFSGVSSVGDNLFISQVENNIKSFLDWGFLHIGGFINVTRNTQNIYNNNLSKLKPTKDPNFDDGRVWQTMRKDWVWESNITYAQPVSSPSPSPSPISATPNIITGIYVNNVSYPLNTSGTYSYIVDYVNSRIIFNNPIPLTSIVEMEYSYRWCQVYTYDNARWWKQLQYKSDQNIAHFDQLEKGDFSILSVNRVQLPSIIIQSVSNGRSFPFRLGDKSLITNQEILLHIMAENMADRNTIIDILRLQQDKFYRLYDVNLVNRNGVGPFFINGTLNPARLNYNDLVTNPDYIWQRARIINVVASEVESFSPFLCEANVRFSVEIVQFMEN